MNGGGVTGDACKSCSGRGSGDELIGRHSETHTHLRQQPWVLSAQAVPVRLRGDVGVAESILHAGRGSDVLVQEFLCRLLRDGFRRHGSAGQSTTCGGQAAQSAWCETAGQ